MCVCGLCAFVAWLLIRECELARLEEDADVERHEVCFIFGLSCVRMLRPRGRRYGFLVWVMCICLVGNKRV